MANEHTCPRCGRPLETSAPQGFCPECLMEAGFATGSVPDHNQPTQRLPFTPPPLPELARLFPQLEILELVGQGGMGAVFKARQKHLDRVVALKILPPGIGADTAFAERFTREAKALARLNHPGVVTLYEFGQTDGLYFFLMEFVDGVSLRELLRGQRLTPREALAIVPQICDALQYAHDQGIVHRDIKPENILLDRQGRVKVADFGLVKLVGTEHLTHPAEQEFEVTNPTGEASSTETVETIAAGPALTDPNKIMGTPNYMAPEQRERPNEVDHRADIYSLGVVFYEMLTGELPRGQFNPPSKKAGLDVRLDEVVLGALAQEPEKRYQHVSEVKIDVETIASTPAELVTSEESFNNPPSTPVPASMAGVNPVESPEPASSRKRAQRIALLGSLLTALLMLGSLGIIWFFKGTPKSQPVGTERAGASDLSAASTPTLAFSIPPRDPLASPNLIDLTEYYNADLNHNWHNSWDKGNDLTELPSGLQKMAGTLFDVRGLVVVGQEARHLPRLIESIRIGQRCQQLHILHSAYNAAYSQGEQIGRYIVHLANGDQHVIPIVTAQDVMDWHKDLPPGSQLVVAWEGDNAKTRARADSGRKIRVFKSTWENPTPDVDVQTLDVESLRRGPAPFLIALTVDPTNAPVTAESCASKAFVLLFNKRDPVSAVAGFEACARDFPDYSEAYHGLALAQRETGDPAKAIPNHDRAIELAPERADYYFARGMTYQRLENHDEAIKNFEVGLEKKPIECLTPGLLHIGLAQSYRAKGNPQKALEYNEQAIALNPGNNGFYRERGITYEALGDHERAAADFGRRGGVLKKPR